MGRRAFDPQTDYPLGSKRPDLVTTLAGLALDDVTLAAARAGTLSATDVRATPETLRYQAAVARSAGRSPLAENLERAAELASVPDGELLEIYTALRPGRSSLEELDRWATRLETHGATQTAIFVREAAATYVERGLLRVAVDR